ncbi:hypothetical protein AVEN_110908-1 [Araneus ventricosus]|uniref:Uncharacterized protein n=1 Tax=Araneus ventricosus TaxID=182803 RepID=A0A4Y2RRA9_ARAVE|nr:hypothetical protein AVEN_110908-1 [Araneus ventricosus]
MRRVRHPPFGVVRNFGEAVSAQVSSSSSDSGPKWRGPVQNSPYVPSKRDVNITKLNFIVYARFTAARLTDHFENIGILRIFAAEKRIIVMRSLH